MCKITKMSDSEGAFWWIYRLYPVFEDIGGGFYHTEGAFAQIRNKIIDCILGENTGLCALIIALAVLIPLVTAVIGKEAYHCIAQVICPVKLSRQAVRGRAAFIKALLHLRYAGFHNTASLSFKQVYTSVKETFYEIDKMIENRNNAVNQGFEGIASLALYGRLNGG